MEKMFMTGLIGGYAMPKDQADKALNREVSLNELEIDMRSAMSLLHKIQGDFTSVHEAVWPLVFTTILSEVRAIRRSSSFGEFAWPITAVDATDAIKELGDIGQRTIPMEQVIWEYVTHWSSGLSVDKALNDYGKDGWELVTIACDPEDGGQGLFFKRRKIVKVDNEPTDQS